MSDLTRALKDENARVREFATQAMEERKEDTAIEALISTLKLEIGGYEIQEIIRNIRALGRIGDERAIEPLIDVSKNASDRGVRRAANKAIEKINQTNQ